MKMTKELDARARAYAKKMCEQCGDEEQIWTDSYNTYVEIAAEQKKIDIEKACEWFANYLFEIGYPDDWVRDNGTWTNGAARFRKAMED